MHGREKETNGRERERASVSVLFPPKNDDKLVLYKSSKSQPLFRLKKSNFLKFHFNRVDSLISPGGI
jgi:hypothetical protein